MMQTKLQTGPECSECEEKTIPYLTNDEELGQIIVIYCPKCKVTLYKIGRDD